MLHVYWRSIKYQFGGIWLDLWHMMTMASTCRIRVPRSWIVCVMFCSSWFVLLSFFFWPLCCLSFLDLRLLFTPCYLQTFLILLSFFFWPLHCLSFKLRLLIKCLVPSNYSFLLQEVQDVIIGFINGYTITLSSPKYDWLVILTWKCMLNKQCLVLKS